MGNNHLTKIVAFFVCLFCSPDGWGAGLEGFAALDEQQKQEFISQFQSHVFDYQNVDNSQINEVVEYAIRHRSDEIRMQVIAGVAYEAMASINESGQPRRSVNAIPDLKSVLVTQIREGLRDSSWIQRKQVPHWWLGYIVLAAYYPNDPDVEDLLVESVDTLPETAGDFMEFLTFGKFDSQRVTELRYEMAMNKDPTVALKAIRGIGRTRPEGGLDTLVLALSRGDNALAEVFEAFAAYGEAAVPFLSILETKFVDVQSGQQVPLTNITLQRMQESIERIAALKE